MGWIGFDSEEREELMERVVCYRLLRWALPPRHWIMAIPLLGLLPAALFVVIARGTLTVLVNDFFYLYFTIPAFFFVLMFLAMLMLVEMAAEVVVAQCSPRQQKDSN